MSAHMPQPLRIAVVSDFATRSGKLGSTSRFKVGRCTAIHHPPLSLMLPTLDLMMDELIVQS